MPTTKELSEQLLLLPQLPSVGATWHYDYRDSNSIYIGNLPPQMNEHDILIMFSQWGIPVFVKLMRDKISGKSHRYAFLRYEQWESTVLAVDNANGVELIPKEMIKDGDNWNGGGLKVDHCTYKGYKYDAYVKGGDANRVWDDAVTSLMQQDFVDAEKHRGRAKDKSKDRESTGKGKIMAGETNGQSKKRGRKEGNHRRILDKDISKRIKLDSKKGDVAETEQKANENKDFNTEPSEKQAPADFKVAVTTKENDYTAANEKLN
ncbi:U2 snRNP complex subunit [Martiniozyma asiatica (nom. inval.)]|nr:U2 snRNP complex subunit [Martiniozyma asiatica]